MRHIRSRTRSPVWPWKSTNFTPEDFKCFLQLLGACRQTLIMKMTKRMTSNQQRFMSPRSMQCCHWEAYCFLYCSEKIREENPPSVSEVPGKSQSWQKDSAAKSTTEINKSVSLNTQCINSRGREATAGKEPTREQPCQLRTGNWGCGIKSGSVLHHIDSFVSWWC